MPSGQEFIRHEFDEAIAVQQSIVQGAGELAEVHPLAATKRQLKTAAKESEKWLKRLQVAGSKFGATGQKEEVAQGIDQLAQLTLQNARSGEASEVYEAHAVVINAIRKQQDSAGSIIKIAQSMKDRELAAEAREMQRASKKTADELAKSLTELAVVIATEGQEKPATRSSASRSGGGSSRRGAAGSTAAGSRGGGNSSTRGSSAAGSKSSGSRSGGGRSTKRSG